MFAPMPRVKRQRSSSPPLPDDYVDLASPLDVLIKRRRRDNPSANGYYGGDSYPFPDVSMASSSTQGSYSNEAESSTSYLSRPAVNGRRSRQWQHLNAPSSSSASVSSTSTAPVPLVTYSQPSPSYPARFQHDPHSPDSVEFGRAHSQPEPRNRARGHMMSSSPVRHEPPGSSPFRASQSQSHSQSFPNDDFSPAGSGMGLRVEVSHPDIGENEGWDEDELGREWGEYARENSVLHSIYRQRHGHVGTPSAFLTETPSRPQQHPHHHPHAFANQTPDALRTTAYDPGNSLYPTPYRNQPLAPSSCSSSTRFASMTSSSPFHLEPGSGSGSGSTRAGRYDFSDGAGGEGEEGDILMSPAEAEVRRRYQDANRLLAELAVDRQRRWGET